MNSPKFNQSIYPNKCLFYEDVKRFAKVYFVNAVAGFVKVPGFMVYYHSKVSMILCC